MERFLKIPMTIAWDNDGTKINSEPAHEVRWISVCKEYGVHLTPEMFDEKHRFDIMTPEGTLQKVERPLRGAHGDTICDWILFQMRQNGEKVFPTKPQFYDKLEKAYKDASSLIKPRKGIPELIKKLNAEGFYQLTVTSCECEIAEVGLSALSDHTRSCLSFVIASEHTTRHKPDPMPYALAIRIAAQNFSAHFKTNIYPDEVAKNSSSLKTALQASFLDYKQASMWCSTFLKEKPPSTLDQPKSTPINFILHTQPKISTLLRTD